MTPEALPHGILEVIAGCMFSGKSEELMRRARRATIAQQKIAVFKPALDIRYEAGKVVSHCGGALDAMRIPENVPQALLGHVDDDTQVVLIDEAQFFKDELVGVTEQLVNGLRVRVIVAGLDQDFRADPFGPMAALLARADSVTKLTAICTKCGRAATRTQRLINVAQQVELGAGDKYAARCRLHHSPEPEAA